MSNRVITSDLRLACQTALTPNTMPETKIKIGLTRGLVDGGEIFAQFSLSSTAHYQHLLTYISAICSREKVLAIYWFNRHDREFVLIHDNASMDYCLVQSGLHEILYIITETGGKSAGYNSKHKPEPIQLKTSSPSSGPSPDTANLERSSDEDRPGGNTQREEHIPLRKIKKSASLEWSYDNEQPPSVQEISSRDESAFDMTGRGERPTYYPYLEHYQPSYPARPKPHRTPTRNKRPEPKVNKYHTQSDQSGSLSDSEDDRNAKEADQFMEQEPPKRKKKAKRRANRAALEQKRQEIEMETFKEFASTVTADYLAEMCRAKEEQEVGSKASNGRRLIWVSLWLASFVYAWYNIALSIGVYMSKPTATKLNFYEASSDGVTFPTVTICNFNKFNKSYFDTDDITTKKGQLKDFLKITTPIWGHKQELDSDSWDTKYDKIVQQSMKDALQTASHSLEGTVEFCKFSGKPCLPADANPGDIYDVEDADPTAAFNPVFTEHGLCYSFNQNGNLTMSRTGALYGLSLRLHVAQDDYFETQDVAGFKVLLHNSYEPPMIEEYGFALRPGSETYVRIRLQKYKDTPRPLGYCDPFLEDKFSTNYTISVCVMQYRAINMLKVCGCIAFYMDRPDIVLSGDKPYMKPKICNLKEERTCADNVLEGLALGTLRIDGEKVPEPDCPSPCVYTTYTYTVSQSEYPSSAVKDKVVEEVNRQKGTTPGEEDASSWTIERIRDNYLKVHIYFEELSTLEMERHPSYLISNLIGDVGGQLGLLLGMNICSLVQFTDYIVRFSFFKGFMSLVRLYKARRRNK